MKKVFVIGAHGHIGKKMVKKLSENGNKVFAGLRKESQFSEYKDLANVEPVLFDVNSQPEEMTDAFKNSEADTILFTAGSGGNTGDDQTLFIDLDGAIKSMIAAKNAGIKHYVMISGYFADNRLFWEDSELHSYFVAKHYADEYLRNDSGLNYTIIRPATLTDGKETGSIELIDASNPEKYGQSTITRADTTNYVTKVINDDSKINKVIEIANTGTSK